MLKAPEAAAPCCPLSRWDVLAETPRLQVWGRLCPEHGQAVGSELGLRYGEGDAAPFEDEGDRARCSHPPG